MRLGVYNAILHDRPLPEALEVVSRLGLTGIELNTGGFLPPVHVPDIDAILTSDAARDDYLGVFEGTGVQIAGLNCNGNPLHPNPVIGEKHAEDVRRSIRLAERLGQDRVVTMSGLPGGEPGARRPNWVVNAWSSGYLEVLDHQWEIATAFWTDIDRLARDHGVKVALELHPQNVVFNTADVFRLVESTGATNVGVELDASHLFWQQMDPVTVVRALGPLVFHAAAKDVRVNPATAALYGVLDNRFRRRGPDEPRTNLGGDEWANEWPKPAAWDFVALGKGHDTAYWTEFLRALREVDPQIWVNIEHEDVELGPVEGLEVAARVLLDADAALEATTVVRPRESGTTTSAVAHSKARNTDPRFSKLTLGVCPDQWGVWFPDDEKQIPWERALAEMAEAGFEYMETGPYGYFPTDPKRLRKVMDDNGFTVVAGTGWGVLHKAEAWAETEKTFRAIAETHAAVGAEYIVHLPPLFRDDKTWEWTDDRVLTPDAWKLYIENANRLGQILKDEYGLKMVLHPHGDSHIETPDDIARVFDATDPAYVNLCLDTGHIVYGGGDPLEIVRTYPDRIAYVHIKAFDVGLTEQAHWEDWPFGEAVARGASVRPPAGAPDMKKLVAALAGLDKELYVVCEQDLYPCDPRLPLPNAVMTRQYLASCGLGLL